MRYLSKLMATISVARGALHCATPAGAQTAYVSATGSFTAPTGPYTDFRFTLPTTSDLTLRTWAHAGGTNAAGQVVAPGGIDSHLALFDNGANLIEENDNISPTERDSLIRRPAQAAGSYRLRMTSVPDATGRWAADLVRGNGSLTLDGIPRQNAHVARLSFGAAGAARATLNLANAQPLVIPGSIDAQGGALLHVSSGTHELGGLTTIGPGAAMRHDGGWFRANQGVVVNGGSLESTAPATVGNLLHGPLTVTNGGVATFLAGDIVEPMVSGGGRIATPRLFASEGAGMIEGPGSHAHVTGVNTFGRGLYVGRGSGSNGSLTFSNHSSALISDGTIFVGAGLPQSSGGIGLLRVNNASITVAGGRVLVGNDGGQGTFELDGPDARVNHTGAGRLEIGLWSGPPFVQPGVGAVLVTNGAVFNAPAGGAVIGHTGRLTIADGATFVAPGGVALGYQSTTGPQPELVIGGSTAGWTGRLDLVDRETILRLFDASQRTQRIDQLRSGHRGGAWDGFGIASSAAAASPGHALGYAIEDVGPFDVMRIAYTRSGDADLNRVVDLNDFNALAANFGQAGRHWYQGNFNYDDVVNLNDFNLLAANFGMFANGPQVTPGDWHDLAGAVPEPAVALAVWFAPALSGMTARVRRGVRRESRRRVRPAPGR